MLNAARSIPLRGPLGSSWTLTFEVPTDPSVASTPFSAADMLRSMVETASAVQRTRVAAYGLIVDQDRILLCRLSARVRQHAGYWTLPGGGIDFGEAPVDAMVREVREETGLDVAPVELLGIESKCQPIARGQMHSIAIVYRARLIGGTLRNEVDGSTDLSQWWRGGDIDRDRLVDIPRLYLDRAFQF